MIEQAKALSKHLREAEFTDITISYADTIDALVQEAEQYLSDWKSCTAMNRELLAEVERLNKVVVIKDNLVEDMCKEVERLREALKALLENGGDYTEKRDAARAALGDTK